MTRRSPGNFFIRGKVDGITTPIRTGTWKEDGGFELEIIMRDNGGITKAAKLLGHADNGTLRLRIEVAVQDEYHMVVTQR